MLKTAIMATVMHLMANATPLTLNLVDPTLTAKLNDGRLVSYSLCSEDFDAYEGLGLNYLGAGVAYAVDGVLQDSTRQLYFFTSPQ